MHPSHRAVPVPVQLTKPNNRCNNITPHNLQPASARLMHVSTPKDLADRLRPSPSSIGKGRSVQHRARARGQPPHVGAGTAAHSHSRPSANWLLSHARQDSLPQSRRLVVSAAISCVKIVEHVVTGLGVDRMNVGSQLITSNRQDPGERHSKEPPVVTAEK